MAPSSSAIISGHAAARCRGEGGTSPRVCLDEAWEALCFLHHFYDELNAIIFAKFFLCTRGPPRPENPLEAHFPMINHSSALRAPLFEETYFVIGNWFGRVFQAGKGA